LSVCFLTVFSLLSSCKCKLLFESTSPVSKNCVASAPVLRCGDGRRDSYGATVEECDSGIGCLDTCKCDTASGFTVLADGIDCFFDVQKGNIYFEILFVVF